MHFGYLKKWKLKIILSCLTCHSVAAAVPAPSDANTQSTNTNNPAPILSNEVIHTPDKGVSLSLQQDTLLLAVAQLKSYYTFNDSNAVALELDGGTRVIRANGTYGLALNDHNRFKVTGEYLRESLDFDFLSGDTRQWVQQGAVGAAYEYLLGQGLFQDIAIGMHYSQAQSKQLSDINIPTASESYLIDERRIAGGKDFNGNAETMLKLWRDALLAIGPDYDRVRYDMHYDDTDNPDAQGFGGHARLGQKLKNNFDLQLDSTVSQLFDTYGVGFNWAWNTKENTQVLTGLNSSYTQDHTTERNFWTNGITISVVWDTLQNKQSLSEDKKKALDNAVPLALWIQTPAVRMPDVLAVADEHVEYEYVGEEPPSFVSVVGTCPSGVDLQFSNGSYSASGGWVQSYPAPGTAPATQLFSPAFDSANIMTAPSGAAACLYILNGNASTSLILENSAFAKVQSAAGEWQPGGYSQFWPISPTPANTCIAVPGDCQFQTVA